MEVRTGALRLQRQITGMVTATFDSDDTDAARVLNHHPIFPCLRYSRLSLSHYVGFGRSRIYQLIAGEFPQPIKSVSRPAG